MTSKRAYVLAAAMAFAIACGGGDGGGSPTDTPPAAVDTLPPSTTPGAAITPPAEALAAVEAVRNELLGGLEVSAEDVRLTSVTAEQWPDACLGAPAADETCATVITPGFEVTMQVAETAYTYRTDTTGQNIRHFGVDINSGS